MNSATSFETVIIGGGLAGLTCALRLAEQGVRVAILEKGETDRYMCNSRICGGAFHVIPRDSNYYNSVIGEQPCFYSLLE